MSDRGADPPRRMVNFRNCPGHLKASAMFAAAYNVAAACAAKGITQLPISSCSRSDHLVCQTSANSILKISRRRRCGLSAATGVVGLLSASEV